MTPLNLVKDSVCSDTVIKTTLIYPKWENWY